MAILPRLLVLLGLTLVGSAACSKPAPPAAKTTVGVPARPSILLVTLDTTRVDAIGPEAVGVETPAFNAIVARGRRFRQAYATVPETLPSHVSMMTGLYPAGHGVHENARSLSGGFPVVAEKLHRAGYRTAAFVSSFVLARQFGLARGFDVYDDNFPSADLPANQPPLRRPAEAFAKAEAGNTAGARQSWGQLSSERSSQQTTDAALVELGRTTTQPRFLWVHFNDPHYPYTPPEPFRSQYSKTPYLGEVAAMDQQLGRLVASFEQQVKGPAAIIVVADHGEGLGEHGEAQHGTLVYQSTMHVPLVIVGPGVSPGTSDIAVSTRRVAATILDWADLGSEHSLRGASEGEEVVLGEGMKPFLEYGWQPQVMAVSGRLKAIEAGTLETYDLVNDPLEALNLGAGTSLPPGMRKAVDEYPAPSPAAARAPDTLDAQARQRLASLGYISAGAAPVVRKDAPRPADMTPLLETIEKASGLFAAEQYAACLPLLAQVQAKDPYNLDAALRLATAHSMLGHDAQALAQFEKASTIAPDSPDVRAYLALHYARIQDWDRAAPLLEQAAQETPERLPVLDALVDLRVQQERFSEAVELRKKVNTLRTPTAADLLQLGELAMEVGQTSVATDAFERARTLQGAAFTHDLELGVLYLSARRFQNAREALDRVPESDPEYPMALFKRAQVSVLLHEPDAAVRIDAARKRADATTRPLIEQERLFK